MMCFCVISYAQTTISGSVTDQNNQPLTGANVIVDGTSNGAVTDFDGMYSIKVDTDESVSLTASMVGFKTISQSVDSAGTVNFVLEDEVREKIYN